jgi:hypothetical protein
MPDTPWLTVNQVAALLQLHPATVRRHPALRPLAVKLGKELRFPPEVIAALKEPPHER